jgi:urocanate hydratase
VVALVGNAASIYAEVAEGGAAMPDVVTDLTAAHDPLFGYCPLGCSTDEWAVLRQADPVALARRARSSMAKEVEAMLAMQAAGAVVFENGNNLRLQAEAAGVAEAGRIDGFAERYIRPLFCRGIGPFRWVALSGEKGDLAELDSLAEKGATWPTGAVPSRTGRSSTPCCSAPSGPTLSQSTPAARAIPATCRAQASR